MENRGFVTQVARSDIEVGEVLLFSRAKDSLKEIAIRLLDQQHCKLNVVIGFHRRYVCAEGFSEGIILYSKYSYSLKEIRTK